jgi:hypothetical protein
MAVTLAGSTFQLRQTLLPLIFGAELFELGNESRAAIKRGDARAPRRRRALSSPASL